MINRMVEPTSGTVRLDRQGHRRGRSGEAAPRHRLRHPARGPVPAPHACSTTWRPCRCCRAEPAARPAARAAELLERVGLDPDDGAALPRQLSGGQQQRVGVARALAGGPAGDAHGRAVLGRRPRGARQLQEEFLRLQDDLGKTIVFVTHDIDEAIKLGDQVAVLRVTAAGWRSSPRPRSCWPHPADDFVAGLVGRDRGFRGLSGSCRPPPQVPSAEPRRTRTVDGRCSSSTAMVGRRAGGRRDVARCPTEGTWSGLGLRQRAGRWPTWRPLACRRAGPASTLDGRADGVVRHDRRRSTSAGRVARLGEDVHGALRPDVWIPRDQSARHRRARASPTSGWRWCRSRSGLVLAAAAGLVVVRSAGPRPMLTAVRRVYTIPSLALIVFIPILVGHAASSARSTSCITLVIYSVALLVRTIADGPRRRVGRRRPGGGRHGLPAVRAVFGVSCRSPCRWSPPGSGSPSWPTSAWSRSAALIGVGSLGQLLTDGFQLGSTRPPIVDRASSARSRWRSSSTSPSCSRRDGRSRRGPRTGVSCVNGDTSSCPPRRRQWSGPNRRLPAPDARAPRVHRAGGRDRLRHRLPAGRAHRAHRTRRVLAINAGNGRPRAADAGGADARRALPGRAGAGGRRPGGAGDPADPDLDVRRREPVDPATVDASRGSRHDRSQIATQVEVPDAMPIIFGGVRNATLQVVVHGHHRRVRRPRRARPLLFDGSRCATTPGWSPAPSSSPCSPSCSTCCSPAASGPRVARSSTGGPSAGPAARPRRRLADLTTATTRKVS